MPTATALSTSPPALLSPFLFGSPSTRLRIRLMADFFAPVTRLPPSFGEFATEKHTRLARVHFYSELFTPKHLGFVLLGSRSSASECTVRARMLQLAHGFTALYRWCGGGGSAYSFSSTHTSQVSVLAVIKCLLDQEAGALQRQQRTVSGSSSSSTTSSSTPTPRDRSTKRIVLTSSSSEREHVEALRSQLTVEPLPAAQCGLAQADGRRYPLFPEESPETPMEVLPTPTTEAARLRAIRETQVREVGSSEELNLICSIAAKELDCAVSMVTIVDENELFVAAANLATLEQQTFPRSDAFCAHTILDDQPTIIPHPEADVRFHQSPAVRAMGTRFYCGFPLVAEDDTIIGAVCCIDQKSRELTESQYAVMKKLATTASKVLKVQTLQRRGSDAKQSQPPAPRQQQWRRTASVRAA
ncbi:hypothetical protein P43SY_001566 [Pythium insidiosum]|uniref:GAF domain-containing protein n=1 Tax=Pythium insidiosum TaxID=114742 RepID=A0AAD5M3Z6_PYTIN|nr:hypothetical protein P43SY_001566 [Pythium insidiosum]